MDSYSYAPLFTPGYFTGYTPSPCCGTKNAGWPARFETAAEAATSALATDNLGQGVLVQRFDSAKHTPGQGPLYSVYPMSPSLISVNTGVLYGAAPTQMAWLYFQAAAPAAGYSAYFVTPVASALEAPLTHVSVGTLMRTGGGSGLRSAADQTLTNGRVTLTISAATGLLSQYADSVTGVSSSLVQTIFYYNSSIGSNAPNDGTSDQHQPSGAYILRTNSSTPFPVSDTPATVTLFTGPVVSEAQQVVGTYVTQVARLWAGAASFDNEFTVGPIPNGQAQSGKEVVMRYQTALATAGAWATDSNVREMQVRQRDFRPTWK